MSTSRLFASIALLGVGVALWNGFVSQRNSECTPVAEAPRLGAPMTSAASAPLPILASPVSTVATPVSNSPHPVPPTATTAPAPVRPATIAPMPASIATTAPGARGPAVDATANALFSPAGSVVTEKSQAAAAATVLQPMPSRPLAEDASGASADAASAQATTGALARYRARSRVAKRREKPAAASPKQNRQAQSFEHPLGMR